MTDTSFEEVRKDLLAGHPQKVGLFSEWDPELNKTGEVLETVFVDLSRNLHSMAREWEDKVGGPILFDRINRKSGPGWAAVTTHFYVE